MIEPGTKVPSRRRSHPGRHPGSCTWWCTITFSVYSPCGLRAGLRVRPDDDQPVARVLPRSAASRLERGLDGRVRPCPGRPRRAAGSSRVVPGGRDARGVEHLDGEPLTLCRPLAAGDARASCGRGGGVARHREHDLRVGPGGRRRAVPCCRACSGARGVPKPKPVTVTSAVAGAAVLRTYGRSTASSCGCAAPTGRTRSGSPPWCPGRAPSRRPGSVPRRSRCTDPASPGSSWRWCGTCGL